MAAYGAVVSLLQTVDTILSPGGLPISLNRGQLESLREKVSFLQHFLESSFTKTSNQEYVRRLETKFRDAVFKAEDLVESHISDLLVREPETKHPVQEPETKHPVQEPETKRYKDRNSLWQFLFFVVTNVVIFILVQNLLLFAVKKFVPVDLQSVIFDAVQILISVAVILNLTYFLVQNVEELQTTSILPLILEKIKSRYLKDVIAVDVQNVQCNSEPEDEDLRKVIEEVGSIMEEVIKIKDAYREEDQRPISNLLPAASSSGGDYSVGSGKNVVVGFDSDLKEMRTQLTGASFKLEIVPIVGMGGIGKTTLARKVYDDSYIIYHFDIRAWVTVSQEYSLRQVLLGVLDSAELLTEKMSEKSEELLAECLYKSLKGRRYLIVMDDMWDTEIWDAVKRSFPEDNNGSRVLLTTRLSEVALYANPCSPLHRMRFLNQDESWNLLCNKVFGEKDCPVELEEIGKEIARNCEGLPLAIAVIGGVLSKVSRTTEYWRSVADNLSSVVTKDDEQCMEILSLSYNHLPHRLRACFLYMGVFPEDYEIPVPKLVRLWAAEGFLKPNRSKSLEELAEENLEDLIERNLILVCKRTPNGKIKTCNIHDLIRNLCLQNAQKENFLQVMKCYDDVLQEGVNIPRRLSIHPNILSIHSEILYSSEIQSSSAHSLLCTGGRLIYPSRVYLGYSLLRVLDLVIVRFFHFPDEIIKLVNLRYLALTYNEALPPSISKLWNLQTLVYHNWTYGQCPFLPVEIWMMPKLRHLCVTPCYLPDPHDAQILVNNFFLLENLQTLLEVRNLKCGNDILKRIPNLKLLAISYDVSPL
ncbi:hypothetical protein Pfo_011171 [Paulownia fortunei]|nr:hypothetical protein Pfo_011171 [Paulownia fortunei]